MISKTVGLAFFVDVEVLLNLVVSLKLRLVVLEEFLFVVVVYFVDERRVVLDFETGLTFCPAEVADDSEVSVIVVGNSGADGGGISP